MNTPKILTVIMLNSIVATAFASTVYQFDRSAIQKHTELDLLAVFEPRKQTTATQNKLESYKNTLMVAVCNMVEARHHKNPFHTQSEAEAYATSLAKLVCFEKLNKLALKKIEQKLKNAPQLLNKEIIKRKIAKKIAHKAFLSIIQTGRLTDVLYFMDAYVVGKINKKTAEHTRELDTWFRK